MDAEILVTGLVRLQIVASGAILVVLLLRPLALRWCGPGTTYWLWFIVPLAAMAALLPAREQVVMLPALDVPVLQQQVEPAGMVSYPQESEATAPPVQPGVSYIRLGSGLLIAFWLLGASVLLVRSIVSTRRLASSPMAGPALVGFLRPRLVLPEDFEVRFNANERALILAHEEMHRVSRHVVVNALVEIARCASWFNPLVHYSAARFRADQELSCDTAVIAAHPEARHTYAEALLKAQITGVHLPMGCVWNSGAARRLAERIERLSEQLPGRRRRIAGATSILCVSLAAGYAAWAQQPAQVITVQRPGAESAAAVPMEAPAVEAREAVKAAMPPAPGLGRPWSEVAPVQAPPGASSTAVEQKPQAPVVSNANASADANSGTRVLTVGAGLPVSSASKSPGALDPYAIPRDLQQRMDVVTGGASATYGAGAMRGVVELVLNNRLNGGKSPAAEFASETVDTEWSSRKRNEILESLVALEGEVSVKRIECRSASCGVALTWPGSAVQSGDQQREQEKRIDLWVQDVSKKSGFLRSDTSWMFDQLTTVTYLTTKPLSKPEPPVQSSREAGEPTR